MCALKRYVSLRSWSGPLREAKRTRRPDAKVFRVLFTGPLTIAVLTLISLLFLFGHLLIRAG